MHLQIITFGLNDATEREFIDAANQAAPAFSALGGLLAKVWLENEEEARYGVVYFWEDREAMENAMRRHGNLFEGNGPAFDDVSLEHFSVLENLTRLTQPVLEILEQKPAAAPARARPAAKKATKRAGATKAVGAAQPAGKATKAGTGKATKAGTGKAAEPAAKAARSDAGKAGKAGTRARRSRA